jgi:hypothetical protein
LKEFAHTHTHTHTRVSKYDTSSFLAPIDDMRLTIEQLLDRLKRITENNKNKYKSNVALEERSGILLSSTNRVDTHTHSLSL